MLTPTSTSPNISSSVKRAADGLIAVILAACSIIRDRIAFRRKIERISVDSVLSHHPVKGTVFPPTIDSRLVSCPFATSSQECLHLILDEQIICDHVKRPITVKLLDLDGAIDRLSSSARATHTASSSANTEPGGGRPVTDWQ